MRIQDIQNYDREMFCFLYGARRPRQSRAPGSTQSIVENEVSFRSFGRWWDFRSHSWKAGEHPVKPPDLFMLRA